MSLWCRQAVTLEPDEDRFIVESVNCYDAVFYIETIQMVTSRNEMIPRPEIAETLCLHTAVPRVVRGHNSRAWLWRTLSTTKRTYCVRSHGVCPQASTGPSTGSVDSEVPRCSSHAVHLCHEQHEAPNPGVGGGSSRTIGRPFTQETTAVLVCSDRRSACLCRPQGSRVNLGT